jgi:hypothetical protein
MHNALMVTQGSNADPQQGVDGLDTPAAIGAAMHNVIGI